MQDDEGCACKMFLNFFVIFSIGFKILKILVNFQSNINIQRLVYLFSHSKIWKILGCDRLPPLKESRPRDSERLERKVQDTLGCYHP
jgi:hypothetical protein